jgi:hypothetical protein
MSGSFVVGIVTGLLFRWRVQFAVAQKMRAKLAPVVLADGIEVADLLRDLVRPPDDPAAVALADEPHAATSRDIGPDAVRQHAARDETAP